MAHILDTHVKYVKTQGREDGSCVHTYIRVILLKHRGIFLALSVLNMTLLMKKSSFVSVYVLMFLY